jgi:hypothetical protein
MDRTSVISPGTAASGANRGWRAATAAIAGDIRRHRLAQAGLVLFALANIADTVTISMVPAASVAKAEFDPFVRGYALSIGVPAAVVITKAVGMALLVLGMSLSLSGSSRLDPVKFWRICLVVGIAVVLVGTALNIVNGLANPAAMRP